MPGKSTPPAEAQSAVGSRIDERLDHLEALVAALSAEIDLLRAERHEWQEAEDKAAEAEAEAEVARESRARPSELQAIDPGDDAGLARVAALQLVDAGLDRKAVTAELQRLGMDDPEPVVDEVFRHDQPTRRAS